MYENFYLENNFNLIKKNGSTSTSCRAKGNKLFESNKPNLRLQMEILKEYNKSIAFAPLNSQELALAYGNRSFFTFSLSKYEESILDIDRALSIPEFSLPFIAKLLIRKGQCWLAIDGNKATEIFNEAKRIIDQIQNVEGVMLLKRLQEVCNPKKALPRNVKNPPLKFPEFSRSKEIPCMSDALNLTYNETYGRHLIANRNIKTGEFLMIDDPYVVVPLAERLYIVCSFCLCPAWTGIPCDFCAFAVYCSEECRQKGWTKYHDVECFVMSLIYSNMEYFEVTGEDMMYSVQWRVRFFITASKEKESQMNLKYLIDEFKNLSNCKEKPITKLNENKQFLGQKFAGILSLTDSNNQDVFFKTWCNKNFMKLLVCLCQVKIITVQDKELVDQNITVFNDLVNKMSNIYLNNATSFVGDCNCSTPRGKHQDYCTAKRGAMLGWASCLINHSCSKNVDALVGCNKIILYANKPIKKDEQLFRTYGVTFLREEKLQRQRYLQERYGFNCRCVACEEAWPMMGPSSRKASEMITECWMKSAPGKYGSDKMDMQLFSWKNQKVIMQDLSSIIDKIFLNRPKLTAEMFFLAEDITHLLATFYLTNYATTF